MDESRVEMEPLGVQEWCWALLVGLKAGRWVLGYTREVSRGRKTWHFLILIPVGLEAWSTKKGLTVALWISQVLLT